MLATLLYAWHSSSFRPAVELHSGGGEIGINTVCLPHYCMLGTLLQLYKRLIHPMCAHCLPIMAKFCVQADCTASEVATLYCTAAAAGTASDLSSQAQSESLPELLLLLTSSRDCIDCARVATDPWLALTRCLHLPHKLGQICSSR
jgi:hypothetical protein